MFTGIVEEIGTVQSLEFQKNLANLKVRANRVLSGTRLGDSIAVNGVCLTVTNIQKDVLTFDLMKETLEATSLNQLVARSTVNLEKALSMQSRLSGHFVTGHVDCVSTIKNKKEDANYLELQISMGKDIDPYIVAKGSVCIDGVSLTVGKVGKDFFSVYLIPFTTNATTLGRLKVGDKVNIETDVLAKYVLKQVGNLPRRK